jgi:hypothetical protein
MDDMFYVPTEAEEAEAQKKLEPNYLEDISKGLSGLTEKVEGLSAEPAPQTPQYQPQYQPKQQEAPADTQQAPAYRGVAVDVAEDGTPYVNTENLDKVYGNRFEELQKKNEELAQKLQVQEYEKQKETFIHNKASELMNTQGYEAKDAYDEAMLYANAIENPSANLDTYRSTVRKNGRVLPIKDGMYAHGVSEGNTAPAKMKIGSDEKIVLKVNLNEGQANLKQNLANIASLNRLQDEVYNQWTRAGKVAPQILFADDNLANASNPAEIKSIIESDPRYGKGTRYVADNPYRFLQRIEPA